MSYQALTQTILNIIYLLGILFGIYIYFRKPQEKLERDQAVSNKNADDKAALLSQQLQWTRDGTDRRFTEMQASIKESMTMAQNHIHTVDVKVDNLTSLVTSLSQDIVRLNTIIDERIPKK